MKCIILRLSYLHFEIPLIKYECMDSFFFFFFSKPVFILVNIGITEFKNDNKLLFWATVIFPITTGIFKTVSRDNHLVQTGFTILHGYSPQIFEISK